MSRSELLDLDDRDRALGLRPLTARSLLASMLLGTYPPRLPVRVLVAAAGLFGITESSARTALSRMVSAGDVTAVDGWYELGPDLIDRQRSQDVGRQASRLPWDGSWRTMMVVADRRQAADRSAARAVLTGERLAELREGVWIRPDNLDHGSRLTAMAGEGWIGGRTVFDEPIDIERLWSVTDRHHRADGLTAAIDELTPGFEAGDRSMLARGFIVAAATLRHFRSDPLLPEELSPGEAGSGALRHGYDRFDKAYRRVLLDFFNQSRTS